MSLVLQLHLIMISKHSKFGVVLILLIRFDYWAPLKCLYDNDLDDLTITIYSTTFLRNRPAKNEHSLTKETKCVNTYSAVSLNIFPIL